MGYVLVMVVVFSAEAGVSSNTKTIEFDSQAACERARDAIESGVLQMKGTLGREVFVDCYQR